MQPYSINAQNQKPVRHNHDTREDFFLLRNSFLQVKALRGSKALENFTLKGLEKLLSKQLENISNNQLTPEREKNHNNLEKKEEKNNQHCAQKTMQNFRMLLTALFSLIQSYIKDLQQDVQDKNENKTREVLESSEESIISFSSIQHLKSANPNKAAAKVK